ncbi:MAG: InlB B-repeat-containing protein [Tannerella sp.]|jgi:uncharacterized repeat protein (TIGR02543 family)|nr:InlB B-repeat-containing protein [Tannerella sp.]
MKNDFLNIFGLAEGEYATGRAGTNAESNMECVRKAFRAAAVVALLITGITTAKAQFYYNETCRNKTGVFSYYGNAPGYTANLASGPDAVGDGWLRLTPDSTAKSGWVLLDKTFPSSMPVTIEFDFKIWMQTLGQPTWKPADGFSIFLYDGTSTNPFKIGAVGGGLGYLGQPLGYVGVGIDEFGNFSRSYGSATIGYPPNTETVTLLPGDIGPGYRTQAIAIRDKNSHYVAGTLDSLGTQTLLSWNTATATRPTDAQIYRRVKIEMAPVSPSGMEITVYLKTNASGAFTKIIGPVILPDAAPSLLKLGFAAVTGGQKAIHEVRDVIIRTPGAGDFLAFQTSDDCSNTKESTKISTHVVYLSSLEISDITVRDTMPAGFTPSGNPTFTGTGIGTMSSITNSVTSDGRKVTEYKLAFHKDGEVVITYSGSFASDPAGRTFKSSTAVTPQGLSAIYSELDGKLKPVIDATITHTPVKSEYTAMQALTYGFTPTITPSHDHSTLTQEWAFADGTTSTDAAPSKIYSSTGSKPVALTLTYKYLLADGSFCTVTETFRDTVKVVAPVFAASLSQTPMTAQDVGEEFDFDVTHSTVTGYTPSYAWTFPAGAAPSSSTVKSPSITWYQSGNKSVTLKLTYTATADNTLKFDTTLTLTTSVTAPHYGAAITPAEPVTIIKGTTKAFAVTHTTPPPWYVASYAWTFPTGADVMVGGSPTGTTTSASQTPTALFMDEGNKSVNLTLTYADSGAGSSFDTIMTRQVTVVKPVFGGGSSGSGKGYIEMDGSDITSGGASLAAGDAGTFSFAAASFLASSSYATELTREVAWTFSDGALPASSTSSSESVKWYADGNKTVTLTLRYKSQGIVVADTTITATVAVAKPVFGGWTEMNGTATGGSGVSLNQVETGTFAVYHSAVPSGFTASYQWSFTDGTPASSTASSASVKWLTTGSKSASVKITYLAADNTKYDTTLVIPATIKPLIFGASVSLTPSGSVDAGTSTAYSYTGGSAANVTTRQLWSFGGGAFPSSSTTVSGSTAWYGVGAKTVSLTISYYDGTTLVSDTTITISIAVHAATVSPGGGSSAGTSTAKWATLNGTESDGSASSRPPVYTLDTLIYYIRIINDSPLNGTVDVIDTLPAGLATPVDISDNGVYNQYTRVMKWTALPVAVNGGTKTVSFRTSSASGAATSGSLYDNRALVILDDGARSRYTGVIYHRAAAFTVTFVSAAGGSLTGVTTQQVDYGQYPTAGVQAVADPGYTFAGWKREAYTTRRGEAVAAVTGLTDYTSQAVLGDFTLRALFTANIYSIGYSGVTASDTAGMSLPLSYTVLSPALSIGSPSRRGYTFTGWAGSNGATPQTTVVIPSGSIGNKSYTASWSRNQYTISYSLGGGSFAAFPAVYPSSYNVDTTAITLPVPIRHGYTLSYWRFTSSVTGVTIADGNVIPSGTIGNITATAVWSLNTYSITYTGDWDIAAVGNPSSYTVESGEILLNAPKRTAAYLFAGWDITSSEDCGPWHGVTAIPSGIYGDLTVKAKWSEVDFSIIYDYAGGTASSLGANPHEYDNSMLPVNITYDPSRTGYDFVKWQFESSLTGVLSSAPARQIPTSTVGNIKATAIWQAINYNVTYATAAFGGATNPNSSLTSYNISTSAQALTDPSRTGYDFLGWNVKVVSRGPAVSYSLTHDIPANCYGDVDITPVWKIKDYTITYDYGPGGVGNATANPVTYTYETAAITLNSPSREYYDFVEWTFTTSEGVAPVNGNVIPNHSTGNITATAVWTPSVYTITYFNPDGTPMGGMTPVSYTVVTPTFTLPAPTPPAGKVFVGWSANYFTGYDTAVTLPAAGHIDNLAFTAHWAFDFNDDPAFLVGGGSGLYPTVFQCNPYFILNAGNDALSYRWLLPDGSFSNNSTLSAPISGVYVIEINYGSVLYRDTAEVLYAFDDATILYNISSEPPKVGYPQTFTVHINPLVRAFTTLTWSAVGGTSDICTPLGLASGSNGDTLRITYSSAGSYNVGIALASTYGGINCSTSLSAPVSIRVANSGYFVDANAPAGGDGSSWGSAFSSLQDALNVATKGDYIWVTAGTYSPAPGTSFTLPSDLIEVYGGFSGAETSLDQRDIVNNRTVLQGNGASVILNNGINDVRWDGFTIEGGESSNGGGVQNIGSTVVIANCIIRDNTAVNGGGVAASGGSVSVYNTEISGNTASSLGGGMYYSDGATGVMTNITVAGNLGGGIATSGSASPLFRNSIIADNRGGRSVTGSGATFTYSLVEGSGGSSNWNSIYGINGGMNIDTNPFFVRSGIDANGNIQRGDYRIRPEEGAGRPFNGGSDLLLIVGRHATTMPLYLPDRSNDSYFSDVIEYDLSGRARRYGNRVDMGAYEADPNCMGDIDDNDGDYQINRRIFINPTEGIETNPLFGEVYILSHTDFSLTIAALPGYSLENLTVTTGSAYYDLSGNIEWSRRDADTAVIVFHQVTHSLDIRFGGINPTGQNGQNSFSTKVYAFHNKLYLKVVNPVTVWIYTMTGLLLCEIQVADNEEITLPRGVYIIRSSDGKITKVALN